MTGFAAVGGTLWQSCMAGVSEVCVCVRTRSSTAYELVRYLQKRASRWHAESEIYL
jgi:hypothetical protein